MGISSGWRGTMRARVSPAHWGAPAGLLDDDLLALLQAIRQCRPSPESIGRGRTRRCRAIF